MVEEADLVESARAVAVTVAVWFWAKPVGAVYAPLPLIVPEPAGLTDQVTPALLVPLTVAANCCDPPAATVTFPGEMATATTGAAEEPPPQADWARMIAAHPTTMSNNAGRDIAWPTLGENLAA